MSLALLPLILYSGYNIILYCMVGTTVLGKSVVQWKRYIGSGSQVLNSVILQVTEAFSDRNTCRCHFPRQLTCKAQ